MGNPLTQSLAERTGVSQAAIGSFQFASPKYHLVNFSYDIEIDFPLNFGCGVSYRHFRPRKLLL